MKKIEKNIQVANKKLEKLSKENHYESDPLKTLATSVYAKIVETKNDLAEIDELKNTLDVKKKKIVNQKSEIKSLMNELYKISDSASKELLKRKKKEKEQLEAKEKNENKVLEEQNKKEGKSENKPTTKKNK